MTKNELRKRAQDCLDSGKSKHETYEELKLMTSMKPEEVANIVQGVPTQKNKETHKIPQILLLIAMGIYVALYAVLAFSFDNSTTNVELFWYVVRLLVGLGLFFGFILYRPEAYRFSEFWMGLGLIRFTVFAFFDGFEWLYLVDILLFLVLIFLSAYLELKLFPNYRVVKELYQNRLGEDRLRNTIRFED